MPAIQGDTRKSSELKKKTLTNVMILTGRQTFIKINHTSVRFTTILTVANIFLSTYYVAGTTEYPYC